MSAVGFTSLPNLQEIEAANALLALKGVHIEEQKEAEPAEQDNSGLNLFVKALILLQDNSKLSTAMPNTPRAPSTEPLSISGNSESSELATTKSPQAPLAQPAANNLELRNSESSSIKTPPKGHTSEDDVNSSDLTTPGSSASLSSISAPHTSDDDINHSGLPTPETSGSLTSSVALQTSDDDVNDRYLQAPVLSTSQSPSNSLYLAQDLTVACPHCNERFSLKNVELSPEKNVTAAEKEDLPQVKQESVTESSSNSRENTNASLADELLVEQPPMKRKRNTSFGNSYSESPKKATKNNFTVNYVHVNTNKPLKIKNKGNINGDLVPIGDGYASVPHRLLKYMDWTSYTNATRKLLTAVFSRSVLATHSLTGKPSPAFPNKPAKKQLNPALVNDIVQTVVDNCRVPESVVRTSITTKCADESKMLRSRMKTTKQKAGFNQENISPPRNKSDESDDSC